MTIVTMENELVYDLSNGAVSHDLVRPWATFWQLFFCSSWRERYKLRTPNNPGTVDYRTYVALIPVAMRTKTTNKGIIFYI